MPDDQHTQDVITRIRNAYDSMSKSQQKVAEFLLTRGIDVVYLSAARIAEEVDVNRSTVVRTAQALGYQGFPDLQAALQGQLLGRISAVDRYQFGSRQLIEEMAEQQEDNGASVLHRVIQTEIKNIESLFHRIPVADFEQAVDWLDSAKHIYIIGLRGSAPLALNLAIPLRFVRENCHILEPGLIGLADQLEHLAGDDLLFAISYGRYARETLHCMDYARGAGAKVISLTDSTLSPAAKRSDLAFVIPFRLWLYGNSAAPFAFLNALFSGLFMRHDNAAAERLKRLDAIYDQFHVFGDESE